MLGSFVIWVGNMQVRQREKVIGIFHSDSSVMRLIGAYLLEMDEDWTIGQVYLDMREYDLWVKEQDKKKAKLEDSVSGKTVRAA